MKRNVRILCGACLAMIFGASVLTITPSFAASSLLGTGESNCDWHHYAQVDATSFENGVKEYWACCEHHETVFEKPTSGTISEASHAEGFAKTLSSSDKRYLSAKANVISDAASVDYAAHDYPLASGTFTKQTDPAIGSYVQCSNLTNTNDAIWIAPTNLPNADLLSTFTKVYFWVRSTNNQSLEIRGFDYGALKYSAVVANEWTYFEVDASAIKNGGVGVSHWATHSEPINFDISSIYGLREDAKMIFDITKNVFRGINSSASTYPANQDQAGNATYTANCSDDSMISPYSKATGINRTADQLNFSSEVRTDISVYSKVFFWIRLNGGSYSATISLRYGIYNTLKTLTSTKGVWTLVVITPDEGSFSDLQYYGIGAWGTATDLELDFSPIYAYEADDYDVLYNSATDYWVNYDAVRGEAIVNQKDSGFVNPYSRITGVTRTSGQEKFRPAAETDISGYSKIFFWVRSNQNLTYMKLLNSADAYDETKYIFCIDSLLANTWTQVIVDVDSITTKTLNTIVFGKHGTFDGVALDFGSIYGVR